MTGRVIVSGFGPWGSVTENPTALVLDRLAADADPDVVTLHCPVDSAAVPALVAEALDAHRPMLWIGLGLAVGSAVVAVERIAANLRDFAEADIAGARLSGVPVEENGPAAYLATWPAALIVQQMRAAGVPARASSTAGTFLCNQLMYQVLHGVAARGLPTRVGFLHVPAHPALVARAEGKAAEHASMDLDLMVRAVRLAIAATRADVIGA